MRLCLWSCVFLCRTMEWIEADFGQNVVPVRVTLSDPNFGAFQTGGWSGGGYLQNVVIVVPRRYAPEVTNPAKHVTFGMDMEVWVEVGNVNEGNNGDNCITLPIHISRGGSPVYRLCSKAGHVYLATGTFMFE
uniref:Uncharacterized protein n=1 Tax=Lotharella globosa TaxID=91324 RepID=A0A7S4DF85_9EUKA|mmetsp:Transcript_34797/g.67325  ORF Transcript_34797/g.67325 Transcript_34797/m.67325 type:complete len:133 (+) Transcript_34797:63-461(+)